MDPRIRVLALVIALTIIFHETLARIPIGVGFSLFVLAYILVFQAATRWNKRLRNPWAHAFLLPALAGAFAMSWYSSDPIRPFSWLIVPSALALWSYWTTSPTQRLRAAFLLAPAPLFRETVWPFHRFREHLTLPRSVSHQQAWQILLGLVVGFPLLGIVTLLFSSADATFARLLSTIFHWDVLPRDLGRWFLDLLVGIFFLGFFGTAVRRHLENNAPTETTVEETSAFKEHLALGTFLAAMNLVFLVFVVIQLLYVIQGAGHWVITGLTYADYAKQSFYQLFAVGLLVFAIAFGCYHLTQMHHRLVRLLSLALLAQTGIVLVSAWTRLSLYVSAYDLTLARWWGGAGLLVVGVLLLWCAGCMVRRASFPRFLQGIIFGGFLLSLPLLLINHEGLVADYNMQRFLAGTSRHLDADYLLDLSSDALPPLLTVADRVWDHDPDLQLRAHQRCHEQETELGCLKRELEEERQRLEEAKNTDWRLLTRNDRYALELLSTKK